MIDELKAILDDREFVERSKSMGDEQTTDDKLEELVETLSEGLTWRDIIIGEIEAKAYALYWKIRIKLGWYKHE